MYMFDTQEKTDEIPLHQMYMFDTQEKTDLRKTKKILLSSEQWEAHRLLCKWKRVDLFRRTSS